MSFESTALLALATQAPAIAFSAFESALWDTFLDKPRPREDSDISGDGISHYGPLLALDAGRTPVERLEVVHDDYYSDAVTIAHYGDGSQAITLHASFDGFGIAKRPGEDGPTYEILRLRD